MRRRYSKFNELLIYEEVFFRAGVLNNSFERQKDRVDQDFIVYRIDEKGNYSPEDLVMQQAFTSYYDTKNNCNTYIMVQVFTTDRAYVTKDELKQMKKDNKMKMTYQNILKFERDHKIPALSPKFQQRIQELAK